MNRKMLSFTIILFLCLIIVLVLAQLNNSFTPNREILLFHTGLTDETVLHEKDIWSSVLPYIRYIKFDGGWAHFNDDGSVTPLLGNDLGEYVRVFNVTVEGFRQRYLEVREVVPDAIPIFELGVIDNVDSVNYTQLNTYISGLSRWLKDFKTYAILSLLGEFNFPEDMDGWGYFQSINGEWINSKVESSSFIRIMRLARKVLDENHIDNVLLATHLNLLRDIYINRTWFKQDWLTEFRGIEEYYEGIKQVDIIGFSFYYDLDELDMAWERVRLIRDAVEGEKPVIFIEYANRYSWEPGNLCTAEFVNSSYNKLRQYPFVKGISWLVLQENLSNSTVVAIADNAEMWEGK